MAVRITRTEIIAMHREGQLSSEQTFQALDEIDALNEEEKFEMKLRIRRQATRIEGEFYLMLDQGWAHNYAKWAPDYRQQVIDWMKAIKPYFKGKTLYELQSESFGGLCRQGATIYEGQYFIHLYPHWGDLLAVNVILGPHHDNILEMDLL